MADLEENHIRILHIWSLTDFEFNPSAYITLEFGSRMLVKWGYNTASVYVYV